MQNCGRIALGVNGSLVIELWQLTQLGKLPMRKRRKELETREKFEARQLREAGMSLNDLARWFDVHRATICRGLAEMREKLGPEKLPANRRHLARLGRATSPDASDVQTIP